MADDEQVRIARRGAKAWNKWIDNSYEGINTIPDLSDADLKGKDFSGIDFAGINLEKANLSETILKKANLSKANLKTASFFQANLSNADLREADLSGADLGGANLTGAQLKGAILNNTIFGSTILCNLSLEETIGLDNAVHLESSNINFETVKKSNGKIPYKFLRGCGLSDLDIEYSRLYNKGLDPEQVTDITYKIHELSTGGGIQYFSCFISYSGKDYKFAQKLHDDLQNQGVRCWFDRDDIKIGEVIRPTIDRQIRLRDKFLVILSKNSITSEFVGDETEAALEEEQKSNRLVVFPIRIDDAPMNTRDDWAAKIKRRRHIGDFSNWHDEWSYKKAFEKLLRDLRSTEG